MRPFFMLLFMIVSTNTMIISENTEFYFYVQDECEGVYFLIYQEGNEVKYSVNYSPFSDIDIITPSPPFFPRVLFANETLVWVSLDRVYQRLHVISNETWYEFDYYLYEKAKRESNGLEVISFDHYRNMFTCYKDVCQTPQSQDNRNFTTPIRIQPIGNSTWLIQTKTSIFKYDSKHDMTPMYDWFVFYTHRYRVINGTIYLDGLQEVSYKPLGITNIENIHVMNKNLFVFTWLNGTTLHLESWYVSLTSAPHDFCDIDINISYIVKCKEVCSSEPISLQEIVNRDEYVVFDKPVEIVNFNLTGKMYLKASINITNGYLGGDIIVHDSHNIYCESCTIISNIFDENGENLCIQENLNKINFLPCDPELEETVERNIVLYVTIGSVAGIMLIAFIASAVITINNKIRNKVFPFRNREYN